MTNLITADFNGTQVLFQNNGYLNATSIAKGFGKQPKDYLKTEQTKSYITALAKSISTRTKILVKENQLVKVKNGGNDRGTWLHPKLAVHFARWLSAEFAVWCDEQIESILYGKSQPKLDSLSNSDDRIGLRQAVSALVTKKGLLYPDAYALIHQRFGVEHLEEMTVGQVNEATQYIHEITVSNILEGEVMPREAVERPRLINEKRENRVAAIALMRAGSLAKAKQDRIIDKLEDLLLQARQCIAEHNDCNGMVHDGLTEARFHFRFNHEESKEANAIADSRFTKRFS